LEAAVALKDELLQFQKEFTVMHSGWLKKMPLKLMFLEAKMTRLKHSN
jgi:hypothetical protein